MNINATLIVQMLTFLVFVWFTMAVVWPPILRALEKRRKLIADGIDAADQGRKALDVATKEGELIVAKAREQAAGVLRQAEDRAQGLVDEVLGQARKEAELLVSQARAELEGQVKAARRELYDEIAGLALRAAGQVVMEDLDDDKHHKMVNSLVKSWS